MDKHILPFGHPSCNCKDCRITRAEGACQAVVDWLDNNGHGNQARTRWPELHKNCYACNIYDKALAGVPFYAGQEAVPAKKDGINISASISGIDGVNSLLAEAGYASDSSTRHLLAIVRSILVEAAK